MVGDNIVIDYIGEGNVKSGYSIQIYNRTALINGTFDYFNSINIINSLAGNISSDNLILIVLF